MEVPVRRPLYILSALAVSALALAGCSAASAPDATSSPSASAAGDLCADVASSGAASDAVSVSGEVGQQPTATFTAPLDISDVERTVVAEGTGTPIAAGDYVTYALSAFDAATGQLQGSVGYDGTPVQPQPIAAESVLGKVLGCATPGTRVVATLPASSNSAAQVFVVDLISSTPEAQWCQAEPFAGDKPTVTFTDDKPTITIPATAPEDGVRVEVLKEGDGDTVGAGDTVEVNYAGVKWSDGSTFDSSYDRGQTARFSTDGVVVGFKRALEGQKAGSQVLVSMSPSCGYGEAGSSQQQLAGETLVFVIDIVSTKPTEG
jgi:peptidylprolyl isomerase